MTKRHLSSSKAPSPRLCAALAMAALLFASSAGVADDRELLRFKTTNPYLFLLLDTSASMNMAIGADAPAPGNADDPSSRIWAAKEALFTVFEDVTDVNFGFATMNQDGPRVNGYHWLYYVEALPNVWPLNGQAGAPLWPMPDPDGLTTDLLTVDTDNDLVPDAGDGIPDNDVEGDVLVLGKAFTDPTGALLAGGTCNAPIDLDDTDGIAKLDAFAKLGETGNATTTMWIEYGKGGNTKVYKLSFSRPGNRPDSSPNAKLGEDNMLVKVDVAGPVASCASVPAAATFNLFLRLDPVMNRTVVIDRGIKSAASNNIEPTQALWPWADAKDNGTCTSPRPFTGKGWEGNYDSDVARLIAEGISDPPAPNNLVDVDVYCADPNDPDTCVAMKPMQDTALSDLGRPMDYGDVLPFNWATGMDNRDLILQRLAPNWPEEAPDFGVLHHLGDTVDPLTGVLPLRMAGREPILAEGDTALAKAINDFRCWYMGQKGKTGQTFQKCGQSAYFAADGWSAVACARDPDYGCRRPFLIIISDGKDICGGEDATADVSDLSSFTGVDTWALNLGDPKNCQSGGGLHSIVTPGGGECINVSSKEELKDTIKNILGQIREVSRAFATAAVPTVQTTSDQAIYVSSFTPLNEKSVWDGHLNAFLKPIPLSTEGTPDTSVSCGAGTEAGCLLWDAGTSMEDQVKPADYLGTGSDQRRVGYSLFSPSSAIPRGTRLFDPIDCSDPVTPAFQECIDLLQGMRIPFSPADPAAMAAAQTEANTVINTTLSLKTHTLLNSDGTPGDTIEYVLGDIFHSNPVVIGSPANIAYFVGDLESDGTDCKDDGTGNPGYRCFFLKHRYRRKVLLVGSNDGMLHGFDAGRFTENGTDPATGRTLDFELGNGTGKELFAYMPRKVLPTVKQLASGTEQQYAVDGAPVAADVFMDPAHNGTPDPDEREWRTVIVGGLREGGSGYYALDLTQPDYVGKATDGETTVPQDNGSANFVPRCLTSYNAGECGANEYPAVLWEMADSTHDLALPPAGPNVLPLLPMDEDENEVPDLGDTWSKPNLGRIQLCKAGGTKCAANPANPGDDADVEDHYVVVFGGGVDHEALDKSIVEQGDFLYMVDVETGKVIYKRRLCNPYGADQSVTGCASAGSAAAAPAAVDTDQDGYFDRVYQVTTGGFLFRVDLGPDSAGNVPMLGVEAVTAVNPAFIGDPVISPFVSVDALRVPATDGAGVPLWQPRALFDANWDSDGGLVASEYARQLYLAPSVIFDARLGLFGLAFGTGNREDLWAKNLQTGRFYLFIDDTDALDPAALPLNESALQQVLVADATTTTDFLMARPTGQKGWFIPLDPDDRVITEAFALSGVTFFSAYKPETALTDNTDCDPLEDPDCDGTTELTCGDKQFESNTDNLCARAGFSKNFVVGTINANGFLYDDADNSVRYEAVSTFVTDPFTEPGQNKNTGTDDAGTSTSDALTDREIGVMEGLKSLFSESCRFSNFRVDIKTVASDTRIERIAPVPVCIVEKNWKEF